jgi:hypothetical protein
MRELTFDRIIREVSEAVDNFARVEGREPTRLKLTEKIYNALKTFNCNQIPRWADKDKLMKAGVKAAYTRFPGIDRRNNRIAFYSVTGWGEDQISAE